MGRDTGITAEFCAWSVVRFTPSASAGRACRFRLGGDLCGPLHREEGGKAWSGFFEFPARGEEKGFYEILAERDGQSRVVKRVRVRYIFNDDYFAPRWEHADKIGRWLARRWPGIVRREVLYRYPKFARDIQLLKLTNHRTAQRDRQVILVTGRVHNPESGTTTALLRFVKWLIEGPGARFLDDYVFLIIPITIPLTFAEDPRTHDVNREWQPEMTEPDLLAVRDKVIDRYLPEVWIDCHSFNEKLDLENTAVRRQRFGDHIVAHPVGEKAFDRPYSRRIARDLARFAEQKGHEHRDVRHWFRDFRKGPLCRPGEKLDLDTELAGGAVFSAKDYARYADRGKFGPEGRDWPAMACEYGYFRCHAINMCLEMKPLHVTDGKGALHYSGRYPDSALVKLQRLCGIGLTTFRGQPAPGFPCNLIASDAAPVSGAVMLAAWGSSRREMRESRATLWRNRRSIVVKSLPAKRRTERRAEVYCVRDIRITGAVRFTIPRGRKAAHALVDGKRAAVCKVIGDYAFVPFALKRGRHEIALRLR